MTRSVEIPDEAAWITRGCDCGHCLDATYIAMLNAAHDVQCTGCGWCEWTGRAQYLELSGDPKP